MKNIKLILSSLLLLLLLNNCGLEYMSTNYNKVEFVHSPEFLEAHGDKVQVNFKGKIPPNYFAKKANMEITPVIVSETGSEDSFPKIILQGEYLPSVLFGRVFHILELSDKVDFKLKIFIN